MDEEVEKLRAQGWCQGSVLPAELGDIAAHVELQESERLMVISQDCDVVHRSLDTEPHVELLAFVLTDTPPNPSMSFGKNPRRLHVPLPANGDGCAQFDARRRFRIPRRLLALIAPSETVALEREDVRLITGWIAKRYTRAAFPDAFNERVASADKRVEKQLKNEHAKHITGLFLMLDPRDECDEGKDYRLVLRLTAQQSSLEDKTIESRLATTVNEIGEALRRCNGIDVLECELVSEDDFSLADLRYFQRWDRDHRSHSGRPGGLLPPSE